MYGVPTKSGAFYSVCPLVKSDEVLGSKDDILTPGYRWLLLVRFLRVTISCVMLY